VIREVSGEGVSTVFSQPGVIASPVAWSPDSRYVLYRAIGLDRARSLGTFLIPQRGGTARFLYPESFVVGGFVAADTVVLAPIEGTAHWLKRIVVSSGLVVDSVRLPVGNFLDDLKPSRDGRLLLASHYREGDPEGQLLILDRTGAIRDSIDGDFRPEWSDRPGELIAERYVGGGSRTLIRYRLDGDGRFRPGADTLRTLPERGGIGGVGADGGVVVYSSERAGETRISTATRPDTKGSFGRGRLLGTSTGRFGAVISPGGRWLMLFEDFDTPSGPRVRMTVESFEGGVRQVIEPSAPSIRDVAFSPADDSVAIFSAPPDGRQFTLTVYPLPDGAPSRRGTFPGTIRDAEWLSDGRLTMPGDSSRSIRVFEPNGTVTEVALPDSIGLVGITGRSPTIPALAILSRTASGFRQDGLIHWLDLRDGRLTFVARTTGERIVGGLWWTRDGWVHFRAFDIRELRSRLYRVPIAGGPIEPEPFVDFETGAEVASMAHDGRRAVVNASRTTSDIWLLKAARR